ncbi:NAD(P)H-quinone oxidoreductase [Inquilinus limosus]|uniref:NAD(P)H-quinone oxidoreductase n=1 Tax=Inquilinus limosus MP06 TaxID=1398085 RepID=A0A0A0D6W7_9PROT|nr:NAD(P)H-quinone oxidoreductase [Inquilinus limosus]KGM34376.1 NAD(P)H-quinone oxidoreductase [Inquilinus limosus MP06]
MTSVLPETMTAIVIEAPGGPEVLKPATLPVPAPGAGEILVKVEAAGVNRPDVLQRRGMYNPPPGASPLPGLEVAGTVAALGPDVSGWSVGDPVCALVAGGGYAEYCVAPAPQCLPVPKGLSAAEAAGLPETFFTVWTNVVDRGRLQPGERFLVHGGSSGIGTTAIQLAKARGATVFATAGSAEKCRACLDLGADVAIDYREQDFLAVVKDKTGGRGVDLILDMVGGDYVARNIDALAVDGRQVSIAFLKGSKVEIDLQKVMAKRLTLTGSTLRPRSVAEKGAIAAALKAEAWPLIEAGRIRPVIHATFPLARASEAHALMESSAHVGKIVLLA